MCLCGRARVLHNSSSLGPAHRASLCWLVVFCVKPERPHPCSRRAALARARDEKATATATLRWCFLECRCHGPLMVNVVPLPLLHPSAPIHIFTFETCARRQERSRRARVFLSLRGRLSDSLITQRRWTCTHYCCLFRGGSLILCILCLLPGDAIVALEVRLQELAALRLVQRPLLAYGFSVRDAVGCCHPPGH